MTSDLASVKAICRNLKGLGEKEFSRPDLFRKRLKKRLEGG